MFKKAIEKEIALKKSLAALTTNAKNTAAKLLGKGTVKASVAY